MNSTPKKPVPKTRKLASPTQVKQATQRGIAKYRGALKSLEKR